MIPSKQATWAIVAQTPLPAWCILSVMTAMVCATLWVIWRTHKPWWLVVTRCLSCMLLIGMLFEPAIQVRSMRDVQNRLAIVVDRSMSMTLPYDNHTSRYQQLLTFLENAKHDSAYQHIAQTYSIEWFDLHGPISFDELQKNPDDSITNLQQGIAQVLQMQSVKPLAGIILFSDGANNTGDAHVQTRNIPVYTVLTAQDNAFKDIAIADVISDEFAFVHNTINIEAKLTNSGFDTMTTSVDMYCEDALVAHKDVVLEKNSTQSIVFAIKPDKIGEFVYTLKTPVLSDEIITSNNQHTRVLQIIRDKIRVLQVAGKPSFDERFLRQYLKENTNIDLISFFILRTPQSDTSVPESELSLIPFPVAKLFTTELSSFDVVIFQNFDYRLYNMQTYLPHIKQAIENGLAFIMLGGGNSFAKGGYADSVLADILPVRMHNDNTIHQHITRMLLSPIGQTHPITDLTHGASNNALLWQQLPPLTTYNQVEGLAPHAAALATISAPGSTTNMPIIATMDVGRGRTMSIATDSMWRWRFGNYHDGGAAQRAYNTFWSNTLHFLAHDPALSRVRIIPKTRHVTYPDAANMQLNILSENYRPLDMATVDITLEQIAPKKLYQHDIRITSPAGYAEQNYTALPPNAYRMIARATKDNHPIGEASTVFTVSHDKLEFATPKPAPDTLKSIAQATGGKSFTVKDNFWNQLKLPSTTTQEIDKRRNIDIWDNAWALAIVVALLSLDWILRRRNGYR